VKSFIRSTKTQQIVFFITNEIYSKNAFPSLVVLSLLTQQIGCFVAYKVALLNVGIHKKVL